MTRAARWALLLVTAVLLALAACQPAAPPATPAAAPSEATQAGQPVQPTRAPEPTQAARPSALTPLPAPTQTAPQAEATRGPQPTLVPDLRVVELEWPQRMRLGESDVLRLSLVPSQDGYTASAEIAGHTLQSGDVILRRPPGFTLYATARLDGAGFDVSPAGDQERILPVQERVDWRWSLAARAGGTHRLAVSLVLRWEPEPGVQAAPRESQAFARAIEVQVTSFLGLNRSQALALGLVGLVLGGGLAAAGGLGGKSTRVRAVGPNPRLALEPAPGIHLGDEESGLLRALFARYERAALEGEFESGYSGARTLLALPIRVGGEADAATIVKIGPRESIRCEYENYERFVKDRLPPVTARIQHAPVALRTGRLAAIQYTCIAEPGRMPVSLRRRLLEDPDPAWLLRLFETFGPGWWMQRRPYTFRFGLEYDRLLPPHLAAIPTRDEISARSLDSARVGDVAVLPRWAGIEPRVGGGAWTLRFEAPAGLPGLRLRWQAAEPPRPGGRARIVNTRAGMLREWTAPFERFGLPDPLEGLEAGLAVSLAGARSTIHGDLNLENALAGPGRLVWLIDFAATREGPPLFDFAHLYAELCAHVLAPLSATPRAFAARLQSGDALLGTVDGMARRCLLDPADETEWALARRTACLGALKFANLDPLARHCLVLAAAAARAPG